MIRFSISEGAREAQGLGLGLSIVDRIARVLRLEIRIFSNKGKGTRFSVILPVSNASELAEPVKASAEARAGVALTGLTVYCLDNDARILDGMQLVIERWGCRVHGFASLAAIEEAPRTIPAPDLVLADYHLDGENGLDAIRQLRAIFGDGMPAVLVTADRSSEVRAAAEALDVPVLNKPVKPAALRSLMTRMSKLTPAAAE